MNTQLTYTLDAEDYLAYQLYAASINPTVLARRKKEWVLTTLTFVLLGVLFYSSNNLFLGLYFWGVALLTVFCFPSYSRWRYKKHYLRHVKTITATILANLCR